MNSLRRIFLLVAYVAVSFAVMAFFGVLGKSEGPVQAYYILTSWSTFIYLILYLLGFTTPLSYTVWHELIAFFLYLLDLFLLDNALKRRLRISAPPIPLVIHAVGVLACFLIFGKDGANVPPAVNLLAWIVPAIIACLYFTLEWHLARGSKKPESAGP